MTGKSSSTPLPADSSLAGRLERLINNEQFADVAFRVGEPGEVIFGHKAILSEASEVFRAQFSGMFKESRENVREHEIPIVDIEPGTFKELLRYMYCERVTVTADNVVDISYGSKKYLLTKLNQLCESFVQRNVTEDNVLGVFDSNRRYELEGINRICLDIVCDNPIRIFAHESFLTLARESVRMIASRKAMNCQTDQLLSAIERWIQVNEDEQEDGTKIVAMVREQKGRGVMCKKIHNFAAGHYVSSIGFQQPNQQSSPNYSFATPRSIFSAVSNGPVAAPLDIFGRPANASAGTPVFGSSPIMPAAPTNSSPTQKTFILKIDTDKPCSIYGVGIYIKCKQFEQTVTMDISVERTGMFPTNEKRTVTAREDLYVEEVLFQKQLIDAGVTCTIKVQMHHGITSLFCRKNFESEQPESGLRFTCSNGADPLMVGGQSGTNCCVAYVLYNFGPAGEERKKLVPVKQKLAVQL
uniref:BTB/POZ domain-containing protein 6 n=1 Tax=Culex pipiens TaxID=7175 RepID=A0A8D8FPF1_CULPI